MLLEPNAVYVSPPHAIVTVTDGHLQLSPRPEIPRLFMPVDFMLRSLALTMGRRAIGVVLSGGGTDGALGMQAIKEVDGITFAQDEKSAAQDSMPRSAILTGCVDYVLDPAGIAHELLRVGSHPYLATPAEPATSDLITDGENAEMQKILALMRGDTAAARARSGAMDESRPGRGPADDPHHRPALALSRDRRRSRLTWQSRTASLRLPDRLG